MRRVLEAAYPVPLVLNQERSGGRQSTAILLVLLVALIMLLSLLILVFVYLKFIKPAQLKKSGKRKNNKNSGKDPKDYLSGNLRTINYFSFQALKKVTKNFSESNLLGKGGFGPLYLGKLEDGQLVAVKQLALEKSQQGEAEFLAEVRMITSIQNKNLVRLLGCCSEGPQRLLVYEYMKNKSLDLIIYGKTDLYLDWNTRFQIILGIARGLQYLHED
ncbi:G-type lectin S-receptor-like serine/threonine-protein kinase At1g61390 [Bidens hawaiensis]|uniref:G-type lectin S-receptor-like serine/threonine-protein kinase At1g61390 n=1 Tax=Bidens hawaiensis TaxID=980011 RepID=UPI00404AABDC